MARKKKEDEEEEKKKERVKLRQKKLRGGGMSLYLDTYKNGERKYEFLNIHLEPEVNRAAKARNDSKLKTADAVREQREEELKNGVAKIKKVTLCSKMLLKDWMLQYKNMKLRSGQSGSFGRIVQSVSCHLKAFGSDKDTLGNVDPNFCRRFAEYLKDARQADGKVIAKSTAAKYFKVFSAALNAAVRKGLIESNPTTLLEREERIKAPESTREFLSVEEIKQLMDTRCSSKAVKSAFLFSCFCGLRYSDIEALTWGNIRSGSSGVYAEITMVKTRRSLILPLSDEALRWMPERGGKSDADKVFDLPCYAWVSVVVKAWTKAAGINKSITFHCARHTFATLMLTLNADLYTISRLLGHTKISTTEIYAKIVDKKKDAAVHLADGLFNK